MAMEAMDYELLMTTIYKCDKHAKGGTVGADYYREMEHAVNLFDAQKTAIDNNKPPIWDKSLDDLDYEVRLAIRRLSNRISEALKEAIKSIYDEEKSKMLSTLCSDLIEVGDKGKLDEVIEKSWQVISPRND